MSHLGDSIKSADFKNEKHVPVIEVPSGITSGQPVMITVSVGKEIPHPNTSEHFISWIELFYRPEGSKFAYHLGRADFLAHGATAEGPDTLTCNTEPLAVFKVMLDQPGELIATSWCNVHGLWEGSASITF